MIAADCNKRFLNILLFVDTYNSQNLPRKEKQLTEGDTCTVPKNHSTFVSILHALYVKAKIINNVIVLEAI